MEANIFQMSAEATATGALLRIIVELKYVDGVEAPLAATAFLKAPHDTIVCPLVQLPNDQGIEARLKGSDGYGQPKEIRSTYLWLGAQLNRAQLDHLSRLRSKDSKGDVHFVLNIEVRYLESTATITHLEKGRSLGKPQAAADSVVLRERPTQVSQRILGEGGYGFASAKTYRTSLQHRIPSGDWIHDFAPKFGIGKFCVFELPQPEIFGTDAIHDRARRALEASLKAEEDLRQGRWTAACEGLRKVWELIRNDGDVETLLRKHGYTADAAKSFNEAVRSLFDFSSKFMHVLDKSGNLIGQPEINAQREDAYLVFATAMSMVNLIAQKSR